MVNKIIDVPDDATNVDIKYVKATNLSDYVVGHQTLSVYKMPDAPEKRVIELPAYLLETLTVEKENASGLLGFFDMDGHSAEIMNWLGEFLPEPDNLEPENIAADWYLDHVEFVPKKEPKYRYRLVGFGNQYIDKDELGKLYITSRNTYSLSFTRREIEKQWSEQGFKLSAFKEIEVEE